jgi:hypothetical protein
MLLTRSIYLKASRVVRGGGEQTRKIVVAALVTCMFVFMSMLSVSAVRADQQLRCDVALVLTSPTSWAGTVAGDITGSISITENPAIFVGQTEHFDENTVITTTDGVVIDIHDLGVVSFKSWRFTANGLVTDVSSENMQWLVGYEVHFMGAVAPGEVVYASGTMILMPP